MDIAEEMVAVTITVLRPTPFKGQQAPLIFPNAMHSMENRLCLNYAHGLLGIWSLVKEENARCRAVVSRCVIAPPPDGQFDTAAVNTLSNDWA